jgi:hypothetical protein
MGQILFGGRSGVLIPSRKPICRDSHSLRQFNNGLTNSIHAEATTNQRAFWDLCCCNWLDSRVRSSLKSTEYWEQEDQGAIRWNRTSWAILTSLVNSSCRIASFWLCRYTLRRGNLWRCEDRGPPILICFWRVSEVGSASFDNYRFCVTVLWRQGKSKARHKMTDNNPLIPCLFNFLYHVHISIRLIHLLINNKTNEGIPSLSSFFYDLSILRGLFQRFARHHGDFRNHISPHVRYLCRLHLKEGYILWSENFLIERGGRILQIEGIKWIAGSGMSRTVGSNRNTWWKRQG